MLQFVLRIFYEKYERLQEVDDILQLKQTTERARLIAKFFSTSYYRDKRGQRSQVQGYLGGSETASDVTDRDFHQPTVLQRLSVQWQSFVREHRMTSDLQSRQRQVSVC
jgi:hypothetical protein